MIARDERTPPDGDAIELRPEPATVRDVAALVIERATIALVQVHEVDLEEPWS